MIPGALIPVNVAVEDDRLPTDDDITSLDNETEWNDVASDENIVSGSDSDDDWIFTVGVSHDLKIYLHNEISNIVYVR